MTPPRQLKTPYKNEKRAIAAVDQARSAQDWTTLISALSDLSEARQEQAKRAKNGKRVQLIESPDVANKIKEGGRFLVRPPLVGRDAGLMHNALKEKHIASLFVCREPTTKLGLCPIVALGSGVTVRVQVDEPKDFDKPTCAWFDHALSELGAHVVEEAEKQGKDERELDFLLAHIPAVSSYKPAYLAAIACCKALKNRNG